MSEFKVSIPWYERINIKALSNEVERKIFKKVKSKLGYSKTVEVLSISRGTLRNYLHYLYGIKRVPSEVVKESFSIS